MCVSISDSSFNLMNLLDRRLAASLHVGERDASPSLSLKLAWGGGGQPSILKYRK